MHRNLPSTQLNLFALAVFETLVLITLGALDAFLILIGVLFGAAILFCYVMHLDDEFEQAKQDRLLSESPITNEEADRIIEEAMRRRSWKEADGSKLPPVIIIRNKDDSDG